MSNSITFTCWDKDEQIEIQLEPEALLFKVMPGNKITFEGNSTANDFKWALRIDHNCKGIQLMPDGLGVSNISIYENGVLLDDWYKYM